MPIEDEAQVFFDKDGTLVGRREEGSLGADMLITREGARVEDVDLKLGRGWSMKKSIEIAKRPGAKPHQVRPYDPNYAPPGCLPGKVGT